MDYDTYLALQQDEENELLIAQINTALADHCTGRGCDAVCLTGKDADLDGGRIGLNNVRIEGDLLVCDLTYGLTVVGDEVCLNVPASEEDAAHEAYMEQMTEIVVGSSLAGEWDGDSWYLFNEFTVSTPLLEDASETATALIAQVWEDVKETADEGEYIHMAGNALAGWCDWDGNRLPHYEP